ncbi:hypothetical protein WQ57_06040 [Mesobacillus campisalis]|uniref:Uncharacterized protein n=1 Tax=Mesobacillus campisalis TaxID=1408103 RepID=A0A0M2SXL6_9BACI|nr:hypothetical protein WQ57_06040 [Mesobacillus campisalis]
MTVKVYSIGLKAGGLCCSGGGEDFARGGVNGDCRVAYVCWKLQRLRNGACHSPKNLVLQIVSQDAACH